MYQYSFSYVYKGKAYISTINSETFKNVAEIIKDFLIEDRYSYNDEDYASYTAKKLLKIADEHYKIGVIEIQHFATGEKVKKDAWVPEHLYWSLKKHELNVSHIISQDEIILQDHVHNIEGMVEGYLYAQYKNSNMVPLTRFHLKDAEIYKPESNEFYEYIKFENGLGVVDDLLVECLPKNQDEVLQILKTWADRSGLDISNKTIKFEKKASVVNPDLKLTQQLTDQMLQDPERIFYIPSEYVEMYLDNEYPPADELGKMLNNESAGTIACVIDNFKNETLLRILDEIESPKKEEVIELFPQVPSLSKEQRTRFLEIFKYDKEFVETRMDKLNKLFTGGIIELRKKNDLRETEQHTLDEYTLWEEYLKINIEQCDTI